jgi:hypothetical protein
MIGSRPALAAAATALGLALGLGGGAPRPEIAVAAREEVIDRADTAEAALAELREHLTAALDAARSGGARVVAGDEAPGPMFNRAAGVVFGAVGAAADAEDARARLGGARSALAPNAAPLPPAPDPNDLAALAAQLATTASAADTFSVIRSGAESVTSTLEEALTALEAGDIDEADRLTAAAQAAVDAVSGPALEGAVISIWRETVDAMIGAMERLLIAARAGDAIAAEAAAAELAALAEEAPAADRALRIALGEAGSAVSATPLSRLAALLEATDRLLGAVAAAREGAGG